MHGRTTIPEMFVSETTGEGDNPSREGTNMGETIDSFNNESMHSHDDTGSSEVDQTFEEELKGVAARWILKTKETCKLTQSSMDTIIQGVTDFNSYILSKLHDVVKNALESLDINIHDLPQLAQAFDVNSPFFRPFKGVETHYQLLKHCKKYLGLVVSTHAISFLYTMVFTHSGTS